MTKNPNTPWLLDRYAELLTCAVDHDGDGVNVAITAVSERLGINGIYAICCALAETVRRLGFPEIERGDGTLTGDIAIIESAPHAPAPMLWATRFVASYINGDSTTQLSLFHSLSDEADFVTHAFSELIDMAADLARAQRNELAGP